MPRMELSGSLRPLMRSEYEYMADLPDSGRSWQAVFGPAGGLTRPLQSGFGMPPVHGVSSDVLRMPPMMGFVGEYFVVPAGETETVGDAPLMVASCSKTISSSSSSSSTKLNREFWL